MRYINQKILAKNNSAEIILAAYNTGKSEQPVLIKTVLPENIDPIFDRLCYARELLHPGIQPIVEFGKCGKATNLRHYVTSKHTPGVTLTQLLQKLSCCKRNLPLPLVLHIINSVSETIEYLHKQSTTNFMPHGNICPDNIFISFNGEVLMTDTGIADLVKFRYDGISIIPNNHTVFIHDDIKRGKCWKKRYEIFSLGLLLLCMLIGYNHFLGFYNQNDTHKLESPSRFFPSIPAQLNKIIVRSIGNKSFGRYARYGSIREFISDLNFFTASCNICYDRDITAITVFSLFFDSEQIPLQLRYLLWERMIDYCKSGSDNAIKLLLSDSLGSIRVSSINDECTMKESFPDQNSTKCSVTTSYMTIQKQTGSDLNDTPKISVSGNSSPVPPVSISEPEEIIVVDDEPQAALPQNQPSNLVKKDFHAFSSIIVNKNAATINSYRSAAFTEQSKIKTEGSFQERNGQYQTSFSAIRLKSSYTEDANNHPFSKLILKENGHT